MLPCSANQMPDLWQMRIWRLREAHEKAECDDITISIPHPGVGPVDTR
jgi:hypothetical protein